MNDHNVDSLLTATLEGLGVPVARLYYRGSSDTFLTFQRINSQEVNHADDDGQAETHLLRVDLFSKGDYTALLSRTKFALKQAGFYGIVTGPELYEADTGYYHVPLDLNYLEE